MIEPFLHASFDIISLPIILLQLLLPLRLLFHVLHLLSLLRLLELLLILFGLPIELLFLVLLELEVLFVLLGGLDAEVLDALVLRQVVVVDLYSLSLALVVALLSIGCSSFRLGVVISIDAEDLLK